MGTATWELQSFGQLTKRCTAVIRWATYQDARNQLPWAAVIHQLPWAAVEDFVVPYMTMREAPDDSIACSYSVQKRMLSFFAYNFASRAVKRMAWCAALRTGRIIQCICEIL